MGQDVNIAISLDGTRETTDYHRKFREKKGVSVFDAVVDNLNKTPKEYLGNLRVAVTTTSKTIGSIIESIEFLQKMGFKRVALDLDSYEIWGKKDLKFLKKVLAEVRKYYIGIMNTGSLERIEKILGFSLENVQRSRDYQVTLFKEISVSPDGCFFPSDVVCRMGRKDYIVGDVEHGIDFRKLERIYSKVFSCIARGRYTDGVFLSVDRYFYALAHDLKPEIMLANSNRVNRIFQNALGKVLNTQRIYRNLIQTPLFGDFIHRPKYSSGKPIRRLGISFSGAESKRQLLPRDPLRV